MIKSRLTLRVLSVVVFTFVVCAAAQAQATRTWVSGVGDDINPCSRTAPCKTFAGAISKTATNGEINALDSAGYGAVTITKSITINCTGTLGSILAAGTNGIIINLTTDEQKTVRIRGLAINGAGTGINGIRVLSAGKVFVEDTLIDGFTQSGISVESVIPAQIVVRNTTIRNTLSGINVQPGSGGAGTNLTVDSSHLEGNRTGLSVIGSELTVLGSTVIYNATGLQAGAGATVRLSGVTIMNNKTGFAVDGGTIQSFKNNTIHGNGGKDVTLSEVSNR